MQKKGSKIKVIPKIEKPLAVNNIEAIVDAADGIMVARGDLGVEMDLAQVPLVQKQVTAICRRLGKPVIIATQVLQSMIENASPTRAEATDISNAVLEFADAVMLSGETAVGKYPLEAVKALAHICRTTENFSDLQSNPRPPIQVGPEHMQTQAIARSIAQMLDEVKTKCVAVWAEDLDSIRLLSKVRIDVPILSLSSDKLTARQLAFYYGMVSMQHPRPESYEQWVSSVETKLKETNLAQSGDKILMLPPRAVFVKAIDTALILHTVS